MQQPWATLTPETYCHVNGVRKSAVGTRDKRLRNNSKQSGINRGHILRGQARPGVRERITALDHTYTHIGIQHVEVIAGELRENVHGIGFWHCAAEGGEQDGLVQDPSLKCLKSIHTEPWG